MRSVTKVALSGLVIYLFALLSRQNIRSTIGLLFKVELRQFQTGLLQKLLVYPALHMAAIQLGILTKMQGSYWIRFSM